MNQKFPKNSESWIVLTNEHIERMQQVQDNNFMKVFQVANSGTPKCMVRLDSQTLQVKWQILLRKIKQVRKTMDKHDENICKRAIIALFNAFTSGIDQRISISFKI